MNHFDIHVNHVTGNVASLFAKPSHCSGFAGNHVISSDYTCSGTSECSTSAEAEPQGDFSKGHKQYMINSYDNQLYVYDMYNIYIYTHNYIYNYIYIIIHIII